MRVIVAGNRDFNEKALFNNTMTWLLSPDETSQYIEVVSGHCEGADAMGEEFAKHFGLMLKVFPADWDKYGKYAGPRRNKEMAEYASKENGILIAFWDGESRGTRNMIDEALNHKLDVHVIKWKR